VILRPRTTAVFTLLALALSSTAAVAQSPAPAVTPAPATTPAQVPVTEKPAVKPTAPADKGVMVGEPAPNAKPEGPRSSAEESGLAAVYNDKLNGRKTASGKIYDRNALTAAHKTLPFGTQLRVTNTKNNKSVVVTINDRGPFHAGRILDLSPRAAKAIGIHPRGMGDVTTAVVGRGKV
jgi:rare lipoprotein A